MVPLFSLALPGCVCFIEFIFFTMNKLELIDQRLVDSVVEEAKASPRLRMNYNFHTDLNDKCQRLLNAMEPGTVMPIHHHKVAEMYVVLQGRLKVQSFDDDGIETEGIILDPKEGRYGVQIPADTWHSLVVLAPDTVIFEIKEGPFIPHEIGGMMEKG